VVEVISKLIHIIGVFAILVTTGGVSISSHYCGNNFVGNSLMPGTDSCCAMGQSNSCCSSGQSDGCKIEGSQCSHGDQGSDDEQKDCCNTSTNFYVLDQNPLVQNFQFKSFENLDVWKSNWAVVNSVLPEIDKHTANYLAYIPPQLIYDRQERFGIFRC
jgi:hypothetical protein